MTNWRISRLPSQPATGYDDDGAWLDGGDDHGAGIYRKGWLDAWDYIGGNASPGDTVTVLADDYSTEEQP